MWPAAEFERAPFVIRKALALSFFEGQYLNCKCQKFKGFNRKFGALLLNELPSVTVDPTQKSVPHTFCAM